MFFAGSELFSVKATPPHISRDESDGRAEKISLKTYDFPPILQARVSLVSQPVGRTLASARLTPP